MPNNLSCQTVKHEKVQCRETKTKADMWANSGRSKKSNILLKFRDADILSTLKHLKEITLGSATHSFARGNKKFYTMDSQPEGCGFDSRSSRLWRFSVKLRYSICAVVGSASEYK